MKKRLILLIIMLLVLVVIPVGLIGLMSSEAGSHWLLRTVFYVLPAQVSVATMEGRLLDRIAFTDFHYQTDTEKIDIDDLAFAWQPYGLLSGAVKIADVVINGLNMRVIDTKKPQEKSNFDLTAELKLPVQIIVENFLLTDMQFQKGDFVQTLEKLQITLATEGDQLKIKAMNLDAWPISVTVQGQLTLGKSFPFSLKLDWLVNAEQNGLWQGSTTIAGDITKLTFDNYLSSPFNVVLKGELDDLQTAPRITARANWTKMVWPVTGPAPQVKSELGTIELAGLLDDYKIKLNGQLTQQYLPEATLLFKGNGSQSALSIEKLELKSKTGMF
ncbi:MAG: hypothetical protein LUQ06_08135, partial [Methylococcaceae bacterium]|nr:hypothetical protein [Methylococcaceae bacterium]